MELSNVVRMQKTFYQKNLTKNLKFRKESLVNLKLALNVYEDKLMEAVKKDFGKCYEETYLTEILMIKKELNYMIKNIKKLGKVKKVKTGILTFPSKGYIIPEPYGVCFIISPFNYPIHLSIMPLIGAIASGNCAILSLSSKVPHVNRVIKEMLSKVFEEDYVFVLTDGTLENLQEIVESKIDYIFFTGGQKMGKYILSLAADMLTPVCLELGGKCPVIISDDVDFDMVAKKIVFGKFLNAGQTCVSPDYILVTKSQKDKIIRLLEKYINKMYYKNQVLVDTYTKIITDDAMSRLCRYIKKENVLIGGQIDRVNKIIEPTVVEVKSLDESIAKEEIFGPILAVIEINSLDDAINFVNNMEKPLSLYLFSEDKKVINKVLNETSSGGVLINDTVIHLCENNLPFGGVGNSGMGKYHGKSSFDTFTHYKSVLKRPINSDLKIRYSPYKKNLINKLKKL